MNIRKGKEVKPVLASLWVVELSINSYEQTQ